MTIRALLLAASCLALIGCDLHKNVELSERAVSVFHAKYTAALLGDTPVRATKRIGFQTTSGSGGAFVEI